MYGYQKSIFFSGIYGVGKSTLCEKISQSINIPVYSASDLIKNKTSEDYSINKFVRDIDYNQAILIEAIHKILEKEKCIILVGHLCITNKNGGIDRLPESVFKKLYIVKIIILETDIAKVIDNLKMRDKKEYDNFLIHNLMEQEMQYAKHIAELIKVPLYIHNMDYTDKDVENVISFIKQAKVYSTYSR